MSFKYVVAVFEAKLTVMDKSVLNALAHRANNEGVTWPGIGRIADDVGCSVTAVKDALEMLIHLYGVVQITGKRPGKNGDTNEYTLDLDKIIILSRCEKVFSRKEAIEILRGPEETQSSGDPVVSHPTTQAGDALLPRRETVGTQAGDAYEPVIEPVRESVSQPVRAGYLSNTSAGAVDDDDPVYLPTPVKLIKTQAGAVIEAALGYKLKPGEVEIYDEDEPL